MRPIEDALWHWNEIARREQARNRAEASALVPALVQQTAENVVAQLDFERLVRRIPVADIVAQVDVEAVVARVDLAGVIRESTMSVGSEAVDALREQGMALDAWARGSSTGSCSAAGRDSSSCATTAMTERERARALQGTRAGFVSRVVAASIDVVIVFVALARARGHLRGGARSLIGDDAVRVSPISGRPRTARLLVLLLIVVLDDRVVGIGPHARQRRRRAARRPRGRLDARRGCAARCGR